MRKRELVKRSERVRQRLKNESAVWIDQASQRISDPPRSREKQFAHSSSSEDTALLQHARKSYRFFKIGWRLLSFLLVGAFSFAIFTAWQSPDFKVNSVQIKGLQRISENEILDILDIQGSHIFKLETEQIKQQISQHFPELGDIHVSLSLPAQVSIKVFERQPTIAWQLDDRVLWIDSEGILIPARGEANQMLTIKADALPAYNLIAEEDHSALNTIQDKPFFKEETDDLVFFSITKKIEKDLLTAILQLNAWMPNESVLLYQQKRGVGWTDKRGWDVFIGSKLERINDKMLMYETIVRKLEEQGIHPTVVSVEFLHAPYYRLDE